MELDDERVIASRSCRRDAAGEVMEDGLWTGIEAGCRELCTELEDGVHNCLVDLVWTGGWAVGSRLQGGRSIAPVASQQLVEPAAGDRVLTNQSVRALFT